MYRALSLALLLAGVLPAQEASFFPFSFDQDNLQGAPDFSSLNHPLGPADRVIVRDGHFFTIGPDLLPNTADDRRIRFFGVNLAFGANFPGSDDASALLDGFAALASTWCGSITWTPRPIPRPTLPPPTPS